ncbi:MAG: efflux RND transporter periplasmic adaptor subunit [Bacteroidia bacterium]|nr:efflux RND transporter periplasmic adaptor subunit [Bacteroidia bacterium]
MADTRTQRKKKSTLWWIIGLGLTLVVVVVLMVLKKKDNIQVEVETVTTRTILSSVSESGVIQPATEVKIAPDVSGEIVELYFKEGDKVKEGDLLVTIQPENYRSALEQAQASLNTSKANYMSAKADLGQAYAKHLQDSASYQRTNELYKQQVISKMEWENAKLLTDVSRSQYSSAKQRVEASFFTMKSAEASLKQARQNLNRTNIYASMSGTVTQVLVEKGERVVGTIQMSGTEIMRIADLSVMEVKVDINENDIINLSIGDSAVIEVDAFEDKKFKGKVSEIAYSATVSALGSTDQITNFEVKVVIDRNSYIKDPEVMRGLTEEKSPFRPGMSAQVDIFTDREDNVLSVPIQAVTIKKTEAEAGPAGEEKVKNDLQEVVFVLEDGVAKEKEVTTGISDDKYIRIKSGLNGGETVITGPYLVLTKQIKDGTEVTLETDRKAEREKKKKDAEPEPEGSN